MVKVQMKASFYAKTGLMNATSAATPLEIILALLP